MSSIATPEQKKAAGVIRKILSLYQENQDLISIGAYKTGTNPDLDMAIKKMDAVNKFLQQSVDEKSTLEGAIQQMMEIAK